MLIELSEDVPKDETSRNFQKNWKLASEFTTSPELTHKKVVTTI